MQIDCMCGRVAIGCLLLFGTAAYAQQPEQGFCGRVADASGAALPGASVTATKQDISPLVAAADGSGNFCLPLEAGTYSIRVSADGFATVTEQVAVPEPMQQPREFRLEVAGQRDSVTVTEDPGYRVEMIGTALKMALDLRDTPQSITVIPREQIRDQMMMSIGDVVRYTPGITAIQGENNRDQIVIRGNSSSADFFVNGVRDDVQYYRDLYNLERVEALKGPNAMIFGRGGGGGVVNRVTTQARPASAAADGSRGLNGLVPVPAVDTSSAAGAPDTFNSAPPGPQDTAAPANPPRPPTDGVGGQPVPAAPLPVPAFASAGLGLLGGLVQGTNLQAQFNADLAKYAPGAAATRVSANGLQSEPVTPQVIAHDY